LTTDHEKLSGILASLERTFSAAAADASEAAEKARDAKHADLASHHGLTAENRRKIEMTHDQKIGVHDRAARVNQRRAAHARAGYLLHSPTESGDSEYMQKNHEVVDMARRAGRLRQTEENLVD
jgi:hypothetical protein